MGKKTLITGKVKAFLSVRKWNSMSARRIWNLLEADESEEEDDNVDKKAADTTAKYRPLSCVQKNMKPHRDVVSYHFFIGGYSNHFVKVQL